MTDTGLRIDKWLWYARFFRTRTLAARICNASKLRLAGDIVSKAHHKVKPGDVLTFPQGRHIRVIKVLELSTRRGPASEAQQLYEDLKPPDKDNKLPPAGGRPGGGRPTKRDRRAVEKLKGGGEA